MKKLFTLFLIVLGANICEAQIVISGFMNNPKTGTEADYEYVQCIATEDIDFTKNSYALVLMSSSSGVITAAGWKGDNVSSRIYKFNLTSGSVKKGDFFYVGGSKMLINGVGSTSIPPSKWIRTIDYGTTNGDDNMGKANTSGIMPNNGSTATNAGGIAIFSGTTIEENSVPIDAVFFGNLEQQATIDKIYKAGSPSQGYRVPNNDHYSSVNSTDPDNVISQPFFFEGNNTFFFPYLAEADDGVFKKLCGVYDLESKKWTESRTITYLKAVSTLAEIETALITLPISLKSFTAKTKGTSVQLNWVTSSERNNSHFELLRSADGITKEVIATISGKGTSDAENAYSYEDLSAASGQNYYQLKQVDFDGGYSYSNVISVTSKDVNVAGLRVHSSSAEQSVSVYVNVSQEDAGAQFQITEIGGRKIFSQPVFLTKGKNEFKVPVNLQKGIYIATLTTKNEKMSVKFEK